MKIMYVTAAPVPSLSANSIHVMKMSQAFSKAGHKTILVAPEYNRHRDDPAMTGDFFQYYDIKFPFLLKNTQRLIKGRPGGIIHVLQVFMYALSYKPDLIYSRCLFSAWLLTLMHQPVIYERHDSFAPGSAAWKVFDRLLMHKTLRAVTVISASLKGHLCENHDMTKTKIIIAPDGADEVQENPQPLPFAHGDFQIGYVGHLYRGRGIDVIIQVARRLPAYGFHIIGGTKKDFEYWTGECRGLPNIFFYGHMPHSQASRYLGSFDAVLAPYQRKIEVSGGGGDISKWISPLKLFEYMAAGRPIISSDIDVLKEVMETGRNCLLCPPDDIESWASAIERLKSDRQFADAIGAEAKREFLEKYSWDSRVEGILTAL